MIYRMETQITTEGPQCKRMKVKDLKIHLFFENQGLKMTCNSQRGNAIFGTAKGLLTSKIMYNRKCIGGCQDKYEFITLTPI